MDLDLGQHSCGSATKKVTNFYRLGFKQCHINGSWTPCRGRGGGVATWREKNVPLGGKEEGKQQMSFAGEKYEGKNAKGKERKNKENENT
jgi:hypothetical protein